MGKDPQAPSAWAFAVELNNLTLRELRSIAVWQLEGYTVDEVAGKLGRSSRTVARKLQLIRGLWHEESLA